jgi:thioredoxin reductase (NADPH)
VRGDSLAASMSRYLVDEIGNTPNVHVQPRSRVVAVHGTEHLESITIQCDATGTVEQVPATALFIFIGAEPRTDWLGDGVERDAKGFVLTGPDLMRNGKPPKSWTLERDPGLLETSTPGVFAVGDVRHGSVKRVASSVGEGSIAIQFVHHYLSGAAS